MRWQENGGVRTYFNTRTNFAYISDKNEDNATKLSGYDPLGVEKDYWAEGPSDRPKAHQNSSPQELE